MDLRSFEQRIAAGDRLTGDEALQLYRHAPTYWLGRMADQVRQRKHPEGLVTYIIDRNVNYTNVCVARCNFCAFYREVGHGEGYVLAFDEIFKKIEETRALGGVQLLLQGGHNPDLPLAWYEDLFRAVKQRFPDFKLHALSPPEVLHISRMAKLPVPEVIARLIAAGLDSIPGGGAEILVDRVRKLLNCHSKASADEWLDVMRHAHRAGLRTTATMMYGTVETDQERLEHMLRLRAVQDETGGFTAFITWSYQPEHTERGGTEATGIDYLRTLAVARLVLDNFDNLQASWVTQGGKVGQLSLAFGANDMGSVMIEENVVRAAGASYCMDEVEIVRNVEDAGYVPKRRNMHYEILGDPFFREHEVPRTLELSTAREAGATSVPMELVNYEARSPRGQEAARAADFAGLMTAYRAAWACPIGQPPIRDAVIEVDDGIIRSVQPGRRPIDRDLGNVVVLPGLVNAHTHLELSWLRGRVPPANQFTDWVKTLIAIRRGTEQLITPEVVTSVHGAIRELRASGTVAVGDITNSLAAVEPMKAANLSGVAFHELLGFHERDGALIEATRPMRDAAARHGIRISLAPHAPYSTSVELFKAIRGAVSASECPILSVHLGESMEEVELLEKGTGPWRDMLETIGKWRDDWGVPACGPVQFLDRHGVIDARTLVVHGVQFDEGALARLRQIGATLVTCPRSNRWVGAGDPPIDRFYASGVAIAVGTDSLASVEDLNLFSELKTMRWLAPQVPARKILESATLVGAKALGLESDLGSIAPGKRAELICVQLPDAVDDVEEYLVSGIEPAQIQPLNS